MAVDLSHTSSLRQPPRERSPVSGGSVSSPPSSPPTQILLCDGHRYKPSWNMLRKDLSVWRFLPRPLPVVCAAGLRLSPLASCWLARSGNQNPRRDRSRTRQTYQGVSTLLDISQPSVRKGVGGGGWVVHQKALTACGRCLFACAASRSSCMRGGVWGY